MLFLLFHLDQDRYALDAHQVIEVLPLTGIMRIRQAPPAVAGLFNYHGTLVPTIDLSQLILGRVARQRLHTRIILVQYADDHGAMQLLGLIAEKVTEVLQRDPGDFIASGVSAPYVGGVTTDSEGLIQSIQVSQLLSASVRSLLFQQTAAS
jgi:chemotaxis-related protein WspB